MQQHLPQIEELGGSVVAISPQIADESLTMAQKNELAFPVLSDVGNTVARRFGLVFTLSEKARNMFSDFGIDLPTYNGTDTFELPVPGTFVLNSEGVIRAAKVSADYKMRMEPAEIISTLNKLNQNT